MDNELLKITEVEYRAIAEQNPKLAGDLIRKVMSLRNPSKGEDGLEEEWEDGWAPLKMLEDAMRPRAPTEYLVERLLPLPSVSAIYGPPGTFKSMLLMDLAVCVALGKPWLSPAAGERDPGEWGGFRTRQAGVLWVDLDQGEDILCERFGALGRGHRAGGEGRLFWKSLPQNGFNLLDEVDVGEMTIRMRSLNLKLLCIDNLGIAKGMADENSGEMIVVMNALRRLAESTHAALVVLHHSRKDNGYKAKMGDLLRGHTSISAGLDLGLGVERDGGTAQAALKVGKIRRRPLGPFAAKFLYELAPGSDDLFEARFAGDGVDPAISYWAERGSAEAEEGRQREGWSEQIGKAIQAALVERRMNQTEVVKAVQEALPRAGTLKIRRQLEKLADQGEIIVQRGQHNTLWYQRQGGQGELELG